MTHFRSKIAALLSSVLLISQVFVPVLPAMGAASPADKIAVSTASASDARKQDDPSGSRSADKATKSDAGRKEDKKEKKTVDQMIKEMIDEDGFLKDGEVIDDQTDGDTAGVSVEVTEDKKAGKEEEVSEAFEAEQTIDGVTVMVSAPEGVFPAGAELFVRKIEDASRIEEIEATVDRDVQDERTVSESFYFDIKVLYEGEEIQPDTEAGTAQVSFFVDEPAKNLEAVNVYHISDDPGDIKAEELETEVLDESGSAVELREAEDDVVLDNHEVAGYDADDVDFYEDSIIEDGIIEDGVTEDDVLFAEEEWEDTDGAGRTGEAEAPERYAAEGSGSENSGLKNSDPELTRRERIRVNVETTGFSDYLLSFTYGKLYYTIGYTGSRRLSVILADLEIYGTITKVTSSNTRKIVAERTTDGDWEVHNLDTFSLREFLDVTVDGAVYRIIVTDGDSGMLSNVKWTSTTGVGSYTITTPGYFNIILRRFASDTEYYGDIVVDSLLSRDKGTYTYDVRDKFTKSGEYEFRVSFNNGIAGEGYSGKIRYTRPDRQLPQVKNLHWTGSNSVAWNSVSGAAYYKVRLTRSDGATIYKVNNPACTFNKSLSNQDQVTVTAVPANINTYRTGPASAVLYYSSNSYTYGTVKITNARIDQSAFQLIAGNTKTLTATVTPSGATESVYWTSDDTSIATVDRNTGKVKGIKPGSTYINLCSTNHSGWWHYIRVTVVASSGKNGFKQEGGKTYYYSNGVKAKGWKTINGACYYFDPGTGAMTTGERTINRIPCYFDPASGKGLHNGWRKIGQKWYWYENGQRQGTRYDKKGVLGDGTVRGREIYDPKSKAWYWLDAVYEGAKAVNKEVWMPYIYQGENPKTKGKWVLYDSNGAMIKGWHTNKKGTYYYDLKTGAMCKGYNVIGKTTYFFNEKTGILDRNKQNSGSGLDFSSDVNVVLNRNVPNVKLYGSVSSNSGITEIVYDISTPNAKHPDNIVKYSSNFPAKVVLNDVIGTTLNRACFKIQGDKNYGKYALKITVTDRTGKKISKTLTWIY